MNRDELKAALIHALNHGNADRFIECIIKCIDSYEAPLGDLRAAIFLLDIDATSLIRIYERNQLELQQQRRENVLAAIEYARQQRHTALIHAGKAVA